MLLVDLGELFFDLGLELLPELLDEVGVELGGVLVGLDGVEGVEGLEVELLPRK